MKKLVFICSMLIGIASAQTIDITEAKLKSIDSLFKLQFPASEPGAIMILAKDGKPIMLKAYGMSNIELNVALNTDQKMGIGSISNQFTAIAILLLQQENKLNVKDDIRKYLPQYNTWGKTITIEQIIIFNNQLYMEDPEFGTKTQLHWLRDNIFWIKELDREVVFLSDKKGNINELEYSSGMQMIRMHLINELY